MKKKIIIIIFFFFLEGKEEKEAATDDLEVITAPRGGGVFIHRTHASVILGLFDGGRSLSTSARPPWSL